MKVIHTIFVLVMFASSIIFGQTLRLVDQGGTLGSYATISLAVAAANSGDTIKVLSGIYPESVVISKKLFIIAQDSTVDVVSGANAFTFNSGSSGSLLYGFTFRGNVYHPGNYIQNEPIVIANNRFINSYVNFYYWTIIANNYFIKATGEIGIKTFGTDSSHKRIIIFNNTLDSCGIQMAGNFTSVVGNKITNYSGHGILTSGSPNDYKILANKIENCGRAIVFGGNSSNTNFAVSNNLITNCPIGINMAYGWSGPLFSGVISNNIIYNSTNRAVLNEQGISGSSSIYFYSNIFSDNAGTLSFPSSVWDYNCMYNSGAVPSPGINNITSDPLFINPGSNDFKLQAGSPCIDKGHPTLLFSDVDRTRNDMGNYGGSYTMSNYENLSGPKVIGLFTSPTQVFKGNDIIITGSGISK